MAVYDESQKGYRVFIGDLGHYVGRKDVEREFEEYGPIRDVWIARSVHISLSESLETGFVDFWAFKFNGLASSVYKICFESKLVLLAFRSYCTSSCA